MEQNIIGTTIAALRREKGLTQDALAAQLGVSAQAVSKWENGLSCPDILMLPEIAEYFGVSVDALFGRASVSAAPLAVSAPAEPVVVYHDLPWSDEETVLHAVLFVGHKLVGHTPFSRGARERVNVDFRYDGPALDIKSEFSVICGRALPQGRTYAERPFGDNSTMGEVANTVAGRRFMREVRREVGGVLGVQNMDEDEMATRLEDMPLRQLLMYGYPRAKLETWLNFLNGNYVQALRGWLGK